MLAHGLPNPKGKAVVSHRSLVVCLSLDILDQVGGRTVISRVALVLTIISPVKTSSSYQVSIYSLDIWPIPDDRVLSLH